MSGYRINHGLPLDPRLSIIAKKANINKAEALAIWISLLDYASQAETRGSISGIDIDEIAINFNIPAEQAERALGAFRNKKMINAKGTLLDWDKMQKNSSTMRTRALRTRRRAQKEALLKEQLPNKPAANPDSEEEIFKRRARLQKEMLARHEAKGKKIQTQTQPHL